MDARKPAHVPVQDATKARTAGAGERALDPTPSLTDPIRRNPDEVEDHETKTNTGTTLPIQRPDERKGTENPRQPIVREPEELDEL